MEMAEARIDKSGKFKGRRGAVTVHNCDSPEPKCVVNDNGYVELKRSCGKVL